MKAKLLSRLECQIVKVVVDVVNITTCKLMTGSGNFGQGSAAM